MAAIPSFPKGKPFEHLPTFEVLQQRSGLKVAKLRELLKDVPKFKCTDNTVRYEDASSLAALDGIDLLPDEQDDAAVAAAAEPLPGDPVQAALQISNRALSMMSVMMRERGDIVKLCCDVIKTMGEPQKLGNALVQENVAVLQGEVADYRKQHLDVLRMLNDLHDSKAERERKAAADAERSAYRKETFDLAKQHLPKAIEKFQLTTEASLALEMLRAVDPDMLGPIVENALPEEMHARARKLVDILKARRATVTVDAEQAPEQGEHDSGQQQATTESTADV